MLLNLSNHPSTAWGEKQLKASQAYGEVKDLAFPKIDPEAESGDIKKLAEQYSGDIQLVMEQSRDTHNAVHIMGELSFCHALVNKLQAAGIPCLVSTTVRDATEKDGKRISNFRFVRFRKYV